MKFHIQNTCLGIILFSACFWSCKKNSYDTKFDSVVQLKLSTEGLTYVQLDLGKYFIYKDSANGKLDSVVVTTSLLLNQTIPANGLFAANSKEIFLLTLTKIDAGIQTVWEIDSKKPFDVWTPFSMDDVPVVILDTNSVLSFYYPATAIQGLTVEGKLYNNVIETIGDNGADPSSPDYRRAVTYWAKGVGIIKRTKTTGSDTKTYFLIRNS